MLKNEVCCIERQRNTEIGTINPPLGGELMYSTSLTHEQSEASTRAVVH